MIVYTRNGREFVKTGNLPSGTRTVQISIDGRTGASVWKPKKAVAIVSEAIETGHAHANRYEIVEAEVDPPKLVASRIANLVKARNRKSLVRKLRAGLRFFVQQSERGRFSIGDALNHDTEMFPGRFETEAEAQNFIDEFLAER